MTHSSHADSGSPVWDRVMVVTLLLLALFIAKGLTDHASRLTHSPPLNGASSSSEFTPAVVQVVSGEPF